MGIRDRQSGRREKEKEKREISTRRKGKKVEEKQQ